MRAPLNRKETVLRHASPPSKKRKPAKIGCSNFEDSQHPVGSDRWFRWYLCVLCRVHLFCSLVCFLQTRCPAALAQRIRGFDWRCVALPTGAGFLVRTSQGKVPRGRRAMLKGELFAWCPHLDGAHMLCLGRLLLPRHHLPLLSFLFLAALCSR